MVRPTLTSSLAKLRLCSSTERGGLVEKLARSQSKHGFAWVTLDGNDDHTVKQRQGNKYVFIRDAKRQEHLRQIEKTAHIIIFRKLAHCVYECRILCDSRENFVLQVLREHNLKQPTSRVVKKMSHGQRLIVEIMPFPTSARRVPDAYAMQ